MQKAKSFLKKSPSFFALICSTYETINTNAIYVEIKLNRPFDFISFILRTRLYYER